MKQCLAMLIGLLIMHAEAYAGDPPGTFEGLCTLVLENGNTTRAAFRAPLTIEPNMNAYRGWSERVRLGEEDMVAQVLVRHSSEFPELLEVLDAVGGTIQFLDPRTTFGVRDLRGNLLVRNGAQFSIRLSRRASPDSVREARCEVAVKVY